MSRAIVTVAAAAVGALVCGAVLEIAAHGL